MPKNAIIFAMIQTDQPTIFNGALRAAVSSRADGDMKFGLEPAQRIAKNREMFLRDARISIEHSVVVTISYDRTDFTQYAIVGVNEAGRGMQSPMLPVADALVTTSTKVGLFLPLADCVGAILFEPINRILMVSHLGRHSIEQNGAMRSVEFLRNNFSVDPKNVQVWLSPAASKRGYPLRAFEGRGMHDVVHEQLEAVGVSLEHIETSPIDTTANREYFSHSEYLKGNRAQDGRFAIAAMMLEQGEPA